MKKSLAHSPNRKTKTNLSSTRHAANSPRESTARKLLALSSVLIMSALIVAVAIQIRTARAFVGGVNITSLGTPFTQNFDTLPASGSATWTNDSTIPGWYHARTGTGTTIVANNGSSNAGNLYSYGTGTATDRALGSVGSGNAAVGNLFWGVRLENQTGSTITSLQISYTGEQWRNSAAAAQTVTFSYVVGNDLGSLSDFQASGTAVPALDFTSPITGGAAGALDGNLAANRVSLSFSITGLSIANGNQIFIRWSDPDHTGADHGLSIDDFSVTANGGPPVPSLSVDNPTVTEGNSGTTTATFTVSLTAPAGPGGVTFDIATADDSAQDDNPATEDNDYVPNSLTGQTIPAGSSTYAFNVLVNGDTTPEPNETFFVNVTNITGASAGDVQGLGTINNDDVALTPIHDIQGPGASSPIVGSSVTTTGIVTGVRSNGFFIQEPDATVDADPATSEGILVFTGGAPPAAAAIGNLVQVTGTVAEFVPAQDPFQPPLTELTSPSAVLLTTGNPLPVPIPLTLTFPDPAGPHDQLERVEGMRASVSSLTVTGPTLGNINEANATATSTGVFYGVVTGVPRPFREAGIPAPDPAPSGGGTIPPIPRFDSNPERIRVDSDGLTGSAAINVVSGSVVTGLVGPLDFSFRTYTILPDPTPAPVVITGGQVTPDPVSVATADEFTVASYNLQRFFDTVNDPGIGEPVLTPAAFDMRLNKASLGIRNLLRSPDIIGIVEIENLTTLQALAARISADAIAASQPDPEYDAFLVEGNDIGGIDVGFLVKTSVVFGSTPRVSVVEVQQENAGELLVNPDSSTSLLNDRPSLRLNAIINHPGGATFPVTVIVNHLRSLGDANSEQPGSNGWPTDGARVRAKRQKQAESLANLVQSRQTADPTENIVLVGDFNAFEFNDGLGDSMNVIIGTPPPDNETAVPGDGVDLVNPDLDNLFDTAPPADRYSFIFDGNAQSLDHIVVNQPLINTTTARRVEHPRINADHPETARNDGTNGVRLADHDPIVGFFSVAGFGGADLAVTKTDSPDPVSSGSNLTYTINFTNNGPTSADTVTVTDAVPANTTFVSATVTTGSGWSTSSPAVGATGNVVFSKGTVASGETATFTMVVNVSASTADGTVITNSAVAASTTSDPDSDNNTGTATTTVASSADLALTKGDAPDPVIAGNSLTYTVNFVNNGPSAASTVSVSDTLPTGTTFVSATVSSGTGWSTTSPAVGGTGTVTFTKPSVPPSETATFTIVVLVTPSVTAGTVLSNTATASSATTDPTPGNNSATATTTVQRQSDLAVTKTTTALSAVPGGNLTYTITARNNGPSDSSSVSVTDPVPANTTFVSAAVTSGTGWTVSAPAVGATGNIVFQKSVLAPNETATFTVVVKVNTVVSASQITNQVSITGASTDPVATNNTATVNTSLFDVCIFDPTKKLLLRFSKATGAWQIDDCAKRTSISGQGLGEVIGCKINLKHPNAASGSKGSTGVTINATANTCTGIGTATIVINGVTTTLTDPNVNDSTCSCPL